MSEGLELHMIQEAGFSHELRILTPDQRREIDILNNEWRQRGEPYFRGIFTAVVLKTYSPEA